MSETVPEYGGCLWPLDPACAGGPTVWDEYSTEQQQRAHALASATLQRLTGGRVGNCPITVRPCLDRGACFIPYHGGWTSGFHPGVNQQGQWVNTCGCSGTHTCHTGCEVRLPAPVSGITEVKVDGVALNPTDYMVQGNLLVWAGEGDCPWPTGQDMSKPDTEVGTFSITYLNSYPVDSIGACAVGTLALEFARSANNSNKCRLPSNVQSVSRQGVTMELITGAFPDGMTGIREVDAFIALWNPKGLSSDSRVWTPDMARMR
jgi:hypothetical protein